MKQVVSPEEMADAFTQWMLEQALIGKAGAEETKRLAQAFGAGCRYAIRTLR